MKKLFLASNRLPLNIHRNGEMFDISPANELTNPSLKQFYDQYETRWIGNTGLEKKKLTEPEKQLLKEISSTYRCTPLFPKPKTHDLYYHGFSKNTLWPLFHYFPQNANYDDRSWHAYVEMNKLYAEEILQQAADGDMLWIHDYHLLLLPAMIKERRPEISIGLFLHIPFPSFEIMRQLPWRVEIIEGMLGADLIGFHTYDYVRHFLSCVRRLMGYDTIFNRISIGERTLKVDVFPRGIDVKAFETHVGLKTRGSGSGSGEEVPDYGSAAVQNLKGKIILSIDKLDYTKGIPNRLKAYELFLEENPRYLEKVTLLLLAMKTGETSQIYETIKKETDELVGRINGNLGTISWSPVRYLNHQFTFDELIDLYRLSDIALIIPLRDGMNMVAKEYVGACQRGKGVLILSEMAGSAKELHEALIVNPNNLGEIVKALVMAMQMPVEEQVRRNRVMMDRLERYTINRWANEFLRSLENVRESQKTSLTRKVNTARMNEIVEEYKKAEQRILFLDYDGTLSNFKKNPEDARPDEPLYNILTKLTKDRKNTVVIISGRDKETLGRWFDASWNIHFIAEHGVWIKEPGGEWHMIEQIDISWSESVLPLLEYYVDQTPGSFIEHKNFSLVWHYRNADPDLGIQRAWELKDELRTLTSNLNLEIMDGDKVLEIKYSGINKGRAALQKIGDTTYDFIFAVGDDWTDEYTFDAMPEKAFTVKVGTKTTKADNYIESVAMVRKILNCMGGADCNGGQGLQGEGTQGNR